MTEAHAITLCLRHRDPAGFEYLVQRYRREAFVHAVTLLGNSEDAEDACQECFSKAFRTMPRLRKLDRFYPWFYRILRNHCLNVLARKHTRVRFATDVSARLRDRASGERPETALLQREQNTRIREVLQRLPPEHREILVLKYFDDLSYREIALRLGIPRGTVMSRLYYARKAFRTSYCQIDSGPKEGV